MIQPLEKFRTLLRRRRLPAALITQPENRRYLSGFTAPDHGIAESSGALLIPAQGPPFLLTDSRFRLQAERECHNFEVVIYPAGLLHLLKKLLPALAVKRLAVESHYLLYATATSLQTLLHKLGIEMTPLASKPVEGLRLVKTEAEIEKIAKAVRLNEEVFQEVYSELAPGQSETEVAAKIEVLMRRKGAAGPSFPTIVAGGPNGAMPHAVPGARPLQQGEPIVIDMGLILDGYCSDMTRTIVLGKPDARTIELFRLVRKAQLAAISSIKAGITGQEADRAARQVIEAAGLGARFEHSLGHGVGLAVHEAPSLSRRNRRKLKAGMVVTVEPGIYLEGWGGIRLENMVVVESAGCTCLNRDTTFLDL